MNSQEQCHVIVLANPKGGVGKSVTAKALAFSDWLQEQYKSIAIVELDPQGSQRIWMTRRQEQELPSSKVVLETIYDEDLEAVADKLKRLASHFNCLILDLPGESMARKKTKFAVAITRLLSGVMIIPLSDSSEDEDAFKENFLPFLEPYIETNRYWILPSRFHANTKIESAKGYFESILPDGPPCLDAIMPFYAVFGAYSAEGMTLSEYRDQLSGREQDKVEKVCAAVEATAVEIHSKL